MPRQATVTGPTGLSATVNIPEGASPEQISQVVEQTRAALAEKGSTTTTPTTTEGMPGALRIPRSADAPAEAAGSILGGAAAVPAVPELGPAAPVIGAGLGGGMANRALEFLRGSPRSEAAVAREKLGRQGPGELETVAGDTASAIERGASGQMLGDVAAPILGGVARGVGLSRPLEAGAAAAKRAAQSLGVRMSGADLTGSRTVAGIERMPSYFTFGSGIRQRWLEGQAGEAGSAVDNVVHSIAQSNADEITAGRMAQGGIKAASRGFRADAERVFRAFDESVGPEPVVPTTKLREAVGSALERGQQTPYPPPGAARRFQGGDVVVEPTGEVSGAPAARTAGTDAGAAGAESVHGVPPVLESRMLESGGARTSALEPVRSSGPYQGEYAGQQPVGGLEGLIHEATSQEYIPWRLARDIESQLGELTFRGGRTIGNIRQGQTGALYNAVRSDIDTFLSSPGQEGARADLEELKQFYATGKALFNESVVNTIGKRRGAMKPEAIIPNVFRPGAVTDTLDYKLAVPDEAWTASVGSWLNGLRQKATMLVGGDEVFSPRAFVTELHKYEKNGHLDIILGPDGAAQMRELESVLSRVGTAERLAGNASGTGQAVMSWQQLKPLLQPVLLAASGAGGAAVGGIPGAIGGLALPMGIAKFATSQPGIDFLSQGFSGNLARPLVRGAAQLGAQYAIPPLSR